MKKIDFQDALDHLHESFGTLHTGRATPAMVDQVMVQAYGSMMKLQEVASISVPEPQMILIQPWDKTVVKAIETSMRESDLQLNPVVDGEQIRIAVPQLTEEKRRELVKIMNEKAEEARIHVRQIREEEMKSLKEQEKSGKISEDDLFRMEKEVQSLVDQVNKEIKEASEQKESDLMKI